MTVHDGTLVSAGAKLVRQGRSGQKLPAVSRIDRLGHGLRRIAHRRTRS
jgi:hypothetical protein